MKKKKGFTLIELIAVIGITAVFGSIVLAISLSSGKLFAMAQTDSIFNDEARLIMSSLEDDIRTARTIVETPAEVAGVIPVTQIVNIGGVPYDLGVAAEVTAIITKKEAGADVTYIYTRTQVGKEVERRKKLATTVSKASLDMRNVKELTVRNSGVSGDERYTLTLKFEDNKGHTAEYKSVVTPRNS